MNSDNISGVIKILKYGLILFILIFNFMEGKYVILDNNIETNMYELMMGHQ